MKIRLVLLAAFMFAAGHAFAQAPPRTPPPPPTAQTAQTPQVPQAPPAPRREGQPINVRVDLTISEEGGNAPAVKKSVSAVAGDGFSGYVREMASTALVPGTVGASGPVSLNFDAYPVILPSGKVRLTCTIQYVAGQSQGEGRSRTDIKQSLVLNLDSGKVLVISEATDPLSDRHVKVEVTATILK